MDATDQARGDEHERIATLYQELRGIARRQRRHHGEVATLDTTALVSEMTT